MTSRRVLMTLGGLLSLFYLLNPTAGLFEILPDALPLVGNIDEAMAATLLLACLREYGLDLTAWRRKDHTDLKAPKDKSE
ncbi:MAG: DUF1232 domain-containing protein [Candidatus Melainabacteria bacterium HGW-Melainabacteria-1]|nr:MAG: DUF1232 domain-containing protein [Candidatus Melainabacteria bacterium HGW-Melainabacteria-1]